MEETIKIPIGIITLLGFASITILYLIDAKMWWKLENIRKKMVLIVFEQEPQTNKIRVESFPSFLETRSNKRDRVFCRGVKNTIDETLEPWFNKDIFAHHTATIIIAYAFAPVVFIIGVILLCILGILGLSTISGRDKEKEVATAKLYQWFGWYLFKRNAIKENQKFIYEHEKALRLLQEIEIGKDNARSNWAKHKNTFIKEMV